MYHIFFIHSSVNGHLGCFHVLATVNSSAMNIEVHVSFWIMVFSGYMPRSEIAGSYGISIFSFYKSIIIPPVPSDREARSSKWKNDGRFQNKFNGWATERALGGFLSTGQSHWPKRRSLISKNCQRVTSYLSQTSSSKELWRWRTYPRERTIQRPAQEHPCKCMTSLQSYQTFQQRNS